MAEPLITAQTEAAKEQPTKKKSFDERMAAWTEWYKGPKFTVTKNKDGSKTYKANKWKDSPIGSSLGFSGTGKRKFYEAAEKEIKVAIKQDKINTKQAGLANQASLARRLAQGFTPSGESKVSFAGISRAAAAPAANILGQTKNKTVLGL